MKPHKMWGFIWDPNCLTFRLYISKTFGRKQWFFASFDRKKYLKKLPSMQRVNHWILLCIISIYRLGVAKISLFQKSENTHVIINNMLGPNNGSLHINKTTCFQVICIWDCVTSPVCLQIQKIWFSCFPDKKSICYLWNMILPLELQFNPFHYKDKASAHLWTITVLVIIKLTKFVVRVRFGCGSVAVPVNWNFVLISPCFAIFKNVVHSLKPGETPRYSASRQASNYVQRS